MSQQYKVVWPHEIIENDVANWVLSAMDAGKDVYAVTKAMNEIDTFLAARPHELGESHGDWKRVFYVWPVTVYYEIHEDHKFVLINSASVHPRF